MGEKEKAKELILSFYRFAKGQTNEARLINAKLSASLCVDEILNEPKMMWCGNGILDNHYKYWQNVKTEIENYEL